MLFVSVVLIQQVNIYTYVGLDVVVLEVEGVLPDVDANNRDVGEERVLVRRRHHLQLLRLRAVPEPAPAGALDRASHRVHLLLERVHAPEVRHQRVLERPRRELASTRARGREVLPEERVVDVPTAVKLERRLQPDLVLGRGRLGVRLLCRVQAVHVRLVVLLVVKFHDLARDMRLKSLHPAM